MKGSLEEKQRRFLAEIERLQSADAIRSKKDKGFEHQDWISCGRGIPAPRERIVSVRRYSKGTVTNATTNKPSAGDEAILIRLAAGMEEVGHAKNRRSGQNSPLHSTMRTRRIWSASFIKASHTTNPRLRGRIRSKVTVYDVSKKVSGVHAVADLMYLQASQGKLGVTRIFAVDNTSKPPLTQMNDANFEFHVPEGASIDDAQAQTQGGQGVNLEPTPQAEKGRYAFVFPLRPGQTQFQVSYHLTYNGRRPLIRD